MTESQYLTFEVSADRVDSAGSLAVTKRAQLIMDTGMAGRLDAFNPVELLLAALSACMIKGTERVSETLGIEYDSLHVSLSAKRPVDDARIESIDYVITIGTLGDQNKLDLLHKNLMKFGAIYNTIQSGTRLTGQILRK